MPKKFKKLLKSISIAVNKWKTQKQRLLYKVLIVHVFSISVLHSELENYFNK